jgi:hypothetical protein
MGVAASRSELIAQTLATSASVTSTYSRTMASSARSCTTSSAALLETMRGSQPASPQEPTIYKILCRSYCRFDGAGITRPPSGARSPAGCANPRLQAGTP